MPFKKGNKEGAKRREFESALRRIAMRADWDKLNKGLEKLMEQVELGKPWALEMLRDTLDGKPKQTVDGNLNQRVTLVDLSDADSLKTRIKRAVEQRSKPETTTVQ